MKKLLLVIALFVSVNASAQKTLSINPPDYIGLEKSLKEYSKSLGEMSKALSVIKSNSISDVFICENEGKNVGIIKEKVIKLHQVSYYHETLGDKSAESKARKETLANYKKLGYTFDGMVINCKGKFMKFVK